MQTTLKWKSFKRRKVPKLTDAYEIRRVNFAKKFKDLDWSRVRLCSVMNRPSNSTTYPTVRTTLCGGSQESSVPCAPQVKFSPSVLVWGGMTSLGLTKLQSLRVITLMRYWRERSNPHSSELQSALS